MSSLEVLSKAYEAITKDPENAAAHADDLDTMLEAASSAKATPEEKRWAAAYIPMVVRFFPDRMADIFNSVTPLLGEDGDTGKLAIQHLPVYVEHGLGRDVAFDIAFQLFGTVSAEHSKTLEAVLNKLVESDPVLAVSTFCAVADKQLGEDQDESVMKTSLALLRKTVEKARAFVRNQKKEAETEEKPAEAEEPKEAKDELVIDEAFAPVVSLVKSHFLGAPRPLQNQLQNLVRGLVPAKHALGFYTELFDFEKLATEAKPFTVKKGRSKAATPYHTVAAECASVLNAVVRSRGSGELGSEVTSVIGRLVMPPTLSETRIEAPELTELATLVPRKHITDEETLDAHISLIHALNAICRRHTIVIGKCTELALNVYRYILSLVPAAAEEASAEVVASVQWGLLAALLQLFMSLAARCEATLAMKLGDVAFDGQPDFEVRKASVYQPLIEERVTSFTTLSDITRTVAKDLTDVLNAYENRLKMKRAEMAAVQKASTGSIVVEAFLGAAEAEETEKDASALEEAVAALSESVNTLTTIKKNVALVDGLSKRLASKTAKLVVATTSAKPGAARPPKGKGKAANTQRRRQQKK